MVALIRQIIKLEDGTELAPNNNVRIQAMDWQVAEDETFKKVVLRSDNDTKNLSSIVFTDILDPNIRWHARARALIKDSGWTVWGNLDVLEYQQAIDAVNSETIPTRISAPIITTSSNPHNHDASLFTIFVNGFGVVGNAEHTATSWFIEDINGRLVWSDLKDTINKNKIDFKNLVLRNNTIYRIRAMFHGSSGDVSSISCYTIRVGSNNSLELITYLDNVDYRADFTVKAIATDMDIEVTSITWQIISMANAYAEIIFNKTTTGASYGTVVIPANLLKDDTMYVLKFKPNIENGAWKFIQFKTMNIEAYHSALTVTPTNITLIVDQTDNVEIVTPAKNVTYTATPVGIVDFNLENKLITALKPGQAVLAITAQEPDKYANTVNVYVTVNQKDPEFILVSNPVTIIGREILPVKYTTNGRLQLTPHDGIEAILEEDDNQIVFSGKNDGTIRVSTVFEGKTKVTDVEVDYVDPNLVGTKYKVTGTIVLKTALPASWVSGDDDLTIPNLYLSGMAGKTTAITGDNMLCSNNDDQIFGGSFQATKLERIEGDTNGSLTDKAGVLVSSKLFKNAVGGTSTAVDAKQDISFVFTSYSNILKTFRLKVTPLDTSITTKYGFVTGTKASIKLYDGKNGVDLSRLKRVGVNEIETIGYYVLDNNENDTTKTLPIKVTLESIEYAVNDTTAKETEANKGSITLTGDSVEIATIDFLWLSAREATVQPEVDPA